MRDVLVLLVHLFVTTFRLLRPGGIRSIIAESVLLRHQLLVVNRSRQRAPQLRPFDRLIAGLCAGLIRPARLLRCAVVLRPATIMRFHRSLVRRKYRELFSPRRKRHKPGPKGPSTELVAAIVELKRRNPRFGYQRIADQLSRAFDIRLDKDTVRRVLTKHYRPDPGSGGPSWLTFLGHTKESLWSVDLFRCESLLLNSHWIMVVMDHCSRRIIGFAVQKGTLDGPAACRMFGRIISGVALPTCRVPELTSQHSLWYKASRIQDLMMFDLRRSVTGLRYWRALNKCSERRLPAARSSVCQLIQRGDK